MSVAACLVLYTFVIAVLGPRLLLRLTHAGVAPRLGVATWLAAIGSVAASWVVAAGFLAAELLQDWNRPGQIASACFAALRFVASGGSGLVLQIVLLTLTASAIAALASLAWRLAQSLTHARTHTHRHARHARIVGRRVAGLDAVVLDAPERAAYCVAGRPHTIVVTSATLDALDEDHLGAVLAHERAHLAGHHHQILAVTRALATALPRVELFTTGAAEIARLLEMCADDTAARSHSPGTLLGALLALSGCAPLPRGALGATGVDVLARAERLVTPTPRRDRLRTRLLLSAAALLVVGGPLLTGVLALSGLALCNPAAS
ncbi:MAG: Peptidase Ste24p precursor [Amycolatopsis sp.]|uniref:M56 family metallopeptidase n=1 Tax=Amycolatopsis sp. TaxID=37632 RepID=UPI00260EFAE8|nr:M56 family metallopeptidase [Amycolatopsis sp.]MCU1686614.1 Peptidase Ste24p precursor [Amycolatopsis sp.]